MIDDNIDDDDDEKTPGVEKHLHLAVPVTSVEERKTKKIFIKKNNKMDFVFRFVSHFRCCERSINFLVLTVQTP